MFLLVSRLSLTLTVSSEQPLLSFAETLHSQFASTTLLQSAPHPA